ncbi:MAG: ABC transporter permease [Chloroflexi bacterium]|nr:ABC transporter permease [Chloroflexota bacterium]
MTTDSIRGDITLAPGTGAVYLAQAERSRLSRLLAAARAKPLGAISLVIIVVLVLTAALAPLLAPYGPYELGADIFQKPSAFHLMGTDEIGRDVFSRIIYGARISLLVGLLAVGMGTVVGSLVGLVSGYCGGWVDTVLQRFVDIIMAFPGLVLALVVISILGTGTVKSTLAIAVVIIPGAARVVRGVVLSVKERPFVEAARAMGCTGTQIVRRHVVPNVMAPVIILGSITLGNAILIEASLSFLGLGTPLPKPSWGAMLAGTGRRFMEVAPWLALFPGLAISITVLAFNMLGDAVRDLLDPRLRGSR